MYAWIMRRLKQSIKRREPEHEQQVLFFDAVRWMVNKHPELCVACHIPNESKSSIRRRVKLKAAGLRKGMPDIFIPVVRDKYAGLFIEMKVKPNRVSKEQAECLQQLNANGYLACVCWSGDEAIDVLKQYLANEL
jgi:hypothetical protein